MMITPASPQKAREAEKRKARQAEALRANLKRRKVKTQTSSDKDHAAVDQSAPKSGRPR